MRMQRYVIMLCLLSVLAFSQNSLKNSNLVKATTEDIFLARQRNFESARRLLLDAHVSFDPDELLRERWNPQLKAALNAMPEMHEIRYGVVPLSGVYMADTLYLPEH